MFIHELRSTRQRYRISLERATSKLIISQVKRNAIRRKVVVFVMFLDFNIPTARTKRSAIYVYTIYYIL